MAISAFVESVDVFNFDEAFSAASPMPATALPAFRTPFAQPGQQAIAYPALLDEVFSAVLDVAEQESLGVEAQGKRLQALLGSWDVQVHNTRFPDSPRKPLTPLVLPNQFLTATRSAPVKPLGWHPHQQSLTLVIDFNFRRHFELPGMASAAYQLALSEVPHIFVGTKAQLEALVVDVYRLLQREYRSKDLPLPPWRTQQALLSLWSFRNGQPISDKPASAQRSFSQEMGPVTSYGFEPAPLRARSNPLPAKVMMGFDVASATVGSPVSGLVFRPSSDGDSDSSDASDVSDVESDSGSDFASLVGSPQMF